MNKDLKELIRQFLEHLEVERGRSLKTIENYERYLNTFLKFSKINKPSDITDDLLRSFRLWLNRRPNGKFDEGRAETLKRKTQNYYLIALRAFLKYLAKIEVKSLPPDRIDLAKISERSIDLISSDELKRLMESPRKNNDIASLRDSAILELLFSTGLRVSELCSLNRDIDLDSDELSVRGKGDRIRMVFLSDNAKDSVKEYLSKRGDADEALFIQHRKNTSKHSNLRLSVRSIERIVRKYAIIAGISKKVTPHIIRHSFATDLLRNGADLRSVQALLGHANIGTTQIYTHVTDAHLKDIHKKYHGKRT